MNATMRTDTKLYHVLQNETIGTDKKVLLSMIKYMTKDMNTITMNGATMNDVTKDTAMSESAVRNSLSNLVKLELVAPTRLLRSEYIVNPVLCFKGNEHSVWNMYSKIEQQLKL